MNFSRDAIRQPFECAENEGARCDNHKSDDCSLLTATVSSVPSSFLGFSTPLARNPLRRNFNCTHVTRRCWRRLSLTLATRRDGPLRRPRGSSCREPPKTRLTASRRASPEITADRVFALNRFNTSCILVRSCDKLAISDRKSSLD